MCRKRRSSIVFCTRLSHPGLPCMKRPSFIIRMHPILRYQARCSIFLCLSWHKNWLTRLERFNPISLYLVHLVQANLFFSTSTATHYYAGQGQLFFAVIKFRFMCQCTDTTSIWILKLLVHQAKNCSQEHNHS